MNQHEQHRLRTLDDYIAEVARANPNREEYLVRAFAEKTRQDAARRIIDSIPPKYDDSDFSELGYRGDVIQHTIHAMFSPGNRIPGIIFTGPAGCGKTRMAYTVMRYIAELDPLSFVGFYKYPQLVQKLREEFSDGTYQNYGSEWDKVTNTDGSWPGLVILDDIGSGKASDFEMEKFYTIIDTRSEYFDPTIVTTNVHPDNFNDSFFPRVASRLLEYTVIQFPDTDHRVINKKTA